MNRDDCKIGQDDKETVIHSKANDERVIDRTGKKEVSNKIKRVKKIIIKVCGYNNFQNLLILLRLLSFKSFVITLAGNFFYILLSHSPSMSTISMLK